MGQLVFSLKSRVMNKPRETSNELIDVRNHDFLITEAPPDGSGERHKVFVILNADGKEKSLGIASLEFIAQILAETNAALHIYVEVAQPVKKECSVDLREHGNRFLVRHPARSEQTHAHLPGDRGIVEGIGVIHFVVFHLEPPDFEIKKLAVPVRASSKNDL